MRVRRKKPVALLASPHPLRRIRPMKLAFSTNAYTRHTLVDALRGIRAAGFEGVEILADEPHAYPGTMDDASTDAVRRELDRLGLAGSNVNCNCTFGYWWPAPHRPYLQPSL